jgi:hypothetical protein
MTAKIISQIGAIAVGALLVGVSGCSTPDRTSQQVWSDNRTERHVKKALKKSPTYKYNDVKAVAYGGNVQLTGFVETEEQRYHAAEIASGVKGVRQVINEIMIKPSAVGRSTIRDPLGHETGRVMLDTNSPPPSTKRLYPSDPNQINPPAGTPPGPQDNSP